MPGQEHLQSELLTGNFLRLRFATHTVKWDRHTEFTRYSIVQHLPENADLGASRPDLLSELMVPADWLAGIAGRTIAAIETAMATCPRRRRRWPWRATGSVAARWWHRPWATTATPER